MENYIMKITRNMLHELAYEIIEEHRGTKLKRPAVMLESKRYPTHLTMSQRQVLKSALRQHMINEGFMDSIKGVFSGAKKAVSSFIDQFKKAPKNWQGIKSMVNQTAHNFTNRWVGTSAYELYEDKLGLQLYEWFPKYVRMAYMVKSMLHDNKASLGKDFEKWIKNADAVTKEADSAKGKVKWQNILNLFRELARSKERKAFEGGYDKIKGKYDAETTGSYSAFMERYLGLSKHLDQAERMLTSTLAGVPNKREVQSSVKNLVKVLDALENYSN